MANDAAKRLYNTRERLTSTDLNRTRDITYRMIQEVMAGLASPDTDKSGVITGMLVTVNATNRTVTISRGLGILVDTAAQPYPDSRYKWIEVEDAITVSIDTGTGYDRWDVVEIEPGKLVTSTSIVDEWDPQIPPSGSFAPQTRSKEERSSPTLTVRQGSDNSPSPPFFPAGFAGRVPLAYIKVASDGSVSAGTAGIVRCRPLLRPPGALDQLNALGLPRDSNSSTWVQGGGISVNTGDSDFLVTSACQGQFAEANMGFAVPQGANVDMTQDNAWSDGATGKPGSDAPAYAYAAPPPYIETNYPTLASREFLPGADVIADFDTYWHGGLGQENCIIILSTAPPHQSYVAGGPIGTANIRDVPFTQGAATPATSGGEHWVYLGAFDQDGSVAKQQEHKGGGLVIPRQRQPFLDVVDAGAYGFFNMRVPNNSTGNAYHQGYLPDTAVEVHFVCEFASAGSTLLHQLTFDDDETLGTTTPVLKSLLGVVGDGQSVAALQNPITLYLGANGQVQVSNSQTIGNVAQLELRPTSYVDVILAMR